MVDYAKKTTRPEGGTPTRPGKKTNANTSADCGSKPMTEHFPSIAKPPDSQDPSPSTQEVADGWDDLSAASQSSKPDLTNNPFSPLATDQQSDAEESDEDDTDKKTTTPPKDSPHPRPGVTFGNNSVKTIPTGHNPSGRNPYSKEQRGTTG